MDVNIKSFFEFFFAYGNDYFFGDKDKNIKKKLTNRFVFVIMEASNPQYYFNNMIKLQTNKAVTSQKF